MRVAFFGGTFDPPHRGHLAIARAAAEGFALDVVLFAPAAQQPFKPEGASASFADRLTMVRLLCDAASKLTHSRFEGSDVDSPRADGQPNYTIDALRRLKQERNDSALFVIVGADAFLELRRWRDPDALLAVAEWIVVSRPGFSLDELAPLALSSDQGARVHLLEGVHEPASATEVRERLEHGLDCSRLVTEEVLAYIQHKHLYGPPGASQHK